MVNASAPEGTSYEALASYMSKILAVVDTLPEKSVIMTMTGGGGMGSSNSGFVRISLVPPDDRQRSQQEIADALTRSLRDYTFARAYVTQEQTIGGGRGRSLPVQFVIQAQTFDKLRAVIPQFMEKAQADSAFPVVDLDLKFNKPEMTIEIDRERARSLGITVRDIASTLQLYFSGQRYGYFILNGKQYSVIAQADRQDRDAPMDISSIYVRNSQRRVDTARQSRQDVVSQQSAATVSFQSLYVGHRIASMAKGFTLGDGIAEMDKIASEVLDESFSTSLAGTAKDYSESSNTLVFAFLLALTLVYLILAAQFESFRDPLIIMFTVPLALAGAVLSLWLFGQTLNIFSQIGIIALIGIVTKNGILIVEFANQRKAQGLSVREAVIDAAAQRFRPILMTSWRRFSASCRSRWPSVQRPKAVCRWVS